MPHPNDLDPTTLDPSRAEAARARRERPGAGDRQGDRPGGRPPRRGATLRVLAALLALGVLAVAAAALHLVPGWHNPFGERTVDRSGPVLLRSIQDLSRFEAASGNFQVVVDLEKDARFLPAGIRGQRTLFVGSGTVDSYVDFARIGAGALKVSADRRTVEVRVPHARLEPAALDNRRSYVFAVQRGLLDRIGAFFSDNPNSQQQVYVLAQQKIEQASRDSGLTARAEANTRTMLIGMLRALGYTTVTVEFG